MANIQHILQHFILVIPELIFIHPHCFRLSAEPGELAFGKVPGVALQDPHSLFQRHFSIQIGQDFLISKTLHGNHTSEIAHVLQLLDFCHKTAGHHFIHPLINAFI